MSLDLDGMLRRLNLATVRRLHPELIQRAEQEEMSYRDFLSLLVAEEVAHRTQTRIERFTRRARFPFLATVEDFDFTFQTSVRQSLLGSFLGPEMMVEGRSLILCGPAGVGKTHLAISIAYRAIQNGTTALFTEANRLMEELSEASKYGRLSEALEPYVHTGVLVVDEVGYLSCPPDAANVLFQVVNQRYLRCRPMVFTTNKPLDVSWPNLMRDLAQVQSVIVDLDDRRYRLRTDLRGAAGKAFMAAGVRVPTAVELLGPVPEKPPLAAGPKV